MTREEGVCAWISWGGDVFVTVIKSWVGWGRLKFTIHPKAPDLLLQQVSSMPLEKGGKTTRARLVPSRPPVSEGPEWDYFTWQKSCIDNP